MDRNMAATGSLLLLLFFASQLPGQPEAHPLYGSELAAFKVRDGTAASRVDQFTRAPKALAVN